jgi:hypothetical protein
VAIELDQQEVRGVSRYPKAAMAVAVRNTNHCEVGKLKGDPETKLHKIGKLRVCVDLHKGVRFVL